MGRNVPCQKYYYHRGNSVKGGSPWHHESAPGPPWPGPGLVKIDAGMPGRPLR